MPAKKEPTPPPTPAEDEPADDRPQNDPDYRDAGQAYVEEHNAREAGE